MKVQARVQSDVDRWLLADLAAGERATKQAMAEAATALKAGWRAQITGAGLGRRLANSIRSEVYPKAQGSLNAASLIWSKAPKLIGIFDRGATIRAKNGTWLAVPTPAAGRGAGGKRITPDMWEQRTGRKLRFVSRRGRNPLLVADNSRLNSRGVAAPHRGRRRRDGILTREQTVVVFVLVRQTQLAKRLDLDRDVERIGATIPSRIVSAWGTR